MNIIDRYLLRQFLKTFLICFVSLTGLYIVFDAFTNLEEFIRCGGKSGGVWRLLGSFYACQSIAFFDRAAGLITLVSAMFTISWMQRHNEMTALQSAGISRIRIITPLIVVAIMIAALSAVNRELVIPRFREELARDPRNLMGDKERELMPRYDNLTDILIRGKATYRNEKRIELPRFLLPPELGDYGKQLVAENAFYKPPQGNRPGGYLLKGVTEPKGLAKRASLASGGEPLVITPRDAPEWLQPDECFVRSDLTFDQLTGGRAFKEFSSAPQMIAALHNRSLEYGADLRTKIHYRFVKPLLDITLLFLGIPLVVSRENRNVFVAIGMCFGVTTIFFLVEIACQSMGAKSLLDPALAAWVPLIIFVPIAVGLAESMWR